MAAAAGSRRVETPRPRRRRAQRMRLLGHHARTEWRRLSLIGLLTAISSVLYALAPIPLKIITDNAVRGEPLPPVLNSILGEDPAPETIVIAAAIVALLVAVAVSGLGSLLAWLWDAAGTRMVYSLAARIYAHLQRMSLDFHSRRPVGDSLSRITYDSWSVYTATSAMLFAPMSHGLTLAAVAAAAWTLDSSLAVVLFVAAPVVAVATYALGRPITESSRRLRSARSSLAAVTQRTLSTLPLVHAFATQQRHRREFDATANEVVAAAQASARSDRLFALGTGVLTAGGAAVVIYGAARRMVAGELPLGTVLVFAAYVRVIDTKVKELLGTYAQYRAARAGLDRVLEVLGSEVEVRDPVRPRPLARPVRGHVRLESVTAGYSRDRPVLTDIDLDAPPGTTIALVGRTGSGKSTLISLLPRFIDPWQGRITLDGTDLRDLSLTELRRHVALVSQDAVLLPISIADNIAYGRPDATAAEIRAAAHAANADEFIDHLPDRYDTIVGERGATLSGGQRQRIAIARALLKNAPVLILDEPTSALDADTEHLILDALDRLITNRTTFVIAHRLATIRNADTIAVLDSGHITATGTHTQLLTTNPLYTHLHTLQTTTASTPRAVGAGSR